MNIFRCIHMYVPTYLGAVVSDRTFFNHVSVQKCSVTYHCTQVHTLWWNYWFTRSLAGGCQQMGSDDDQAATESWIHPRCELYVCICTPTEVSRYVSLLTPEPPTCRLRRHYRFFTHFTMVVQKLPTWVSRVWVWGGAELGFEIGCSPLGWINKRRASFEGNYKYLVGRL